jgi:aminoglycoside phosphotransferase (APT) family kinase protein
VVERSTELQEALSVRLGGVVTGLRRLSGGASRETWSFALDGAPLILRRDPPSAARSAGMLREAALFRAAAAAGVPVPELVDASDDAAILGSAFLVMAHVEGETIPRKILRDEAYAAARPKLARQCGEVLAKLHSIPLADVPGLEDQDQVAQYRAVLDGVGQPHPTFELAFQWLEANRPAANRRTVVHGDFRNGNLIIGPDGLRAVLDWELAHAGDPMEDLGWLCVKSWRFGVALPVGGFGSYDELIAGYGGDVDREALRWWETLGTLKWGIMCIMQAVTHTSGAVRSVELAAIGRRVCEVEWDLLEALP